MSEMMKEPEDYDNMSEALYPSAQKLIEIAEALDTYGTSSEALDVTVRDDLPERFEFANMMCNEFAKMEQSIDGNIGLQLMMYEGIIFKFAWDMKHIVAQRDRSFKFSSFFGAGCFVLFGAMIYLLTR